MKAIGFVAIGVVFWAGSVVGVWAASDLSLDVSLEELLNVRISTASKYKQTASEAPSAVTIITAEDIARYGYRTIAEVLQAIRGFHLNYDRQYVRVGVRGFSRTADPNNRVLLLLNGEPLNEHVFGQVLFGTGFAVNMDAIERIEVVRGPGSVLYGTNAMFAVINIITKTGKQIDGFRVDAELASFGSRSGTFLYGTELGRTDLLVAARVGDVDGPDLYFKEYDAPETNYGVAKGADWERYRNVLATAQHGDVTLQAFFNTRRKGIPTGVFGTEFGNVETQSLDEQYGIATTYTHQLRPNFAVDLRGSVHRSLFRGLFPKAKRRSEREVVDGTWFGGEATARWDVRVNNRLTFGVDFEENAQMAVHMEFPRGHVWFADDFPYRALSVYAEDAYQITERLSASLGLRRTYHSVRSGNMTTPRGAIIFQPHPNMTLKLLYGESFRVPSVIERQLDLPRLLKRNPDLRAERIRTAEAVLEHRITSFLHGSITAYRYKMIDLVELRLDSSQLTAAFRNVGDVDVLGFETELNVRTGQGVNGYLSYTYQDSDFADTQQSLVDSPHKLVKGGATVPVFRYLNASIEAYWEDGRKTLRGGKTKPFLLVHLNVATRPLLSERLVVSFRVRNVFDVKYETPGDVGHRQETLPQDGRQIAWTVSYRM